MPERAPIASPEATRRPLRLLFLVPGTGTYLCGSCLRDDALVVALRELGHQVDVVPLYLPLVLERHQEAGAGEDARVHLGGINMFLDQKLPWLRLPRFVARLLDRPRLLRWVSRRAAMTGAAELGALTYATLEGEAGPQAREFAALARSLAERPRPDACILSNVMLLGAARPLRRALSVPILCTLQGEAPFLDSLAEPYQTRAWSLLAEQAGEVEGFVAVSGFTAATMASRLRIAADRVEVVHNGIELGDFAARPRVPCERPTVGYLARMCPDKGLHTLVDAWLEIARRGAVPLPRLHAAGVLLPPDRAYVEGLRARIAAAGLAEHVSFEPNVSRARKLELLAGLSVFSVPATYGESFGLYLLEALAAGVPVVQPRHAAFPEILERTGGGLLCEPDDPLALARALEDLLGDPERAGELGERGRRVVHAEYGSDRMAREFEASLRRRLGHRAAAAQDGAGGVAPAVETTHGTVPG